QSAFSTVTGLRFPARAEYVLWIMWSSGFRVEFAACTRAPAPTAPASVVTAPTAEVFDEISTARPHSSQNFALARRAVPQFTHARGREAPQLSQNFAPGRFSVVHAGQITATWY